jgi:ABC-2 type transport system permease protein
MSKVLLLTKASLRNQYGLNRFFGTNLGNFGSGQPPWLKLSLAALVIGLGAAFVFGLLFGFWSLQGGALQQYGLLHLLLMQAVLLSSLVCLLMGILSAPGQLFFSHDYDLLLSLPVRTSTVLMSKMTGLLLSNLVFAIVLALPPLVVYGYKSNAGPLFYLLAVAALPFIPLVPLTFAALFALLTGGIAARFKRSNQYITNLAFIFLLGLMAGFQALTSSSRAAAASLDKVLGAIGTWYPPARLFFEGLKGPSLLSLLLFMALSLGVFVVFSVFFARSFKAILSRLTATSAKANYKLKELTAASVLRALYVKELRGYLSCPIYVMNTFFGMVFLTVFSVGALCFGNALTARMFQQPVLAHAAPLGAVLVAVFTTVVSCTTAVTISLEGRSLWVLKSAPVGPLSIFKGKVLLNLSTTWPLIAVNSVLLAFGLRMDVRHCLLIWVLPSVYALFVAVAGLLINLHFPKLEFKSPYVVVKQSASTLITFVVAFVSVAIPISLYVRLLSERLSYEAYAGGVAAVLLLLTAILWQVARTRGVACFQRLF